MILSSQVPDIYALMIREYTSNSRQVEFEATDGCQMFSTITSQRCDQLFCLMLFLFTSFMRKLEFLERSLDSR
jgi:hypothetical protein